MEAAIQTVVKVFLKSAKGKEGLGGKDFQKLVESQLSNILTDTDSKKAVAEMRQGLDANQDGSVGFNEYMQLVGYLATSLSEQRMLNREPPAQKAVAESGHESTPVCEKDEAKPEAKPEDKPEDKPEAKPEDKAAEVPETATEEIPAAAAAAPAVEAAAAVATPTPAAPAEAAAAVVATAEEVKKEVKEEVKEEANAEEAEKAEKVKENPTPDREEDEEKKTEEATS